MSSFQKGDKLDTRKLKRVKFPLPELGEDKYITLRALAVQEFEEIRGQKDDPGKMSDGDYELLVNRERTRFTRNTGRFIARPY